MGFDFTVFKALLCNNVLTFHENSMYINEWVGEPLLISDIRFFKVFYVID